MRMEAIADSGVFGEGFQMQTSPQTAAMNAFQDERTDEIIVSTFPGEGSSSWLRGDIVVRLRKATGISVEHVVVTAEEAGAVTTQ